MQIGIRRMEMDLQQAMGNRGVMGGKEEEGLVVVGMMWFE